MKDTLLALLVVIIFMVLPILKNYEVVTVLEVGNKSNSYRVTYTEKTIFESNTYNIEFETMAGVETFISEVADYDFSQWKFKY